MMMLRTATQRFSSRNSLSIIRSGKCTPARQRSSSSQRQGASSLLNNNNNKMRILMGNQNRTVTTTTSALATTALSRYNCSNNSASTALIIPRLTLSGGPNGMMTSDEYNAEDDEDGV